MNRVFFFIIIIIAFSCTNSTNEKVKVDFSDTTSLKSDNIPNEAKPIYIAIASMTSPKETFTYYSELINFISEKAGHPIYIKQKKTYEEVNLLLESSEIDFAFICSGAFVDEFKSGKIKLLAAPEIDNKCTYHAYIITQKNNNIHSFKDFENKSFAFTDPLSNTGRLYPLMELSRTNKSEAEFFKKTIYTYGHDISIQMVNRGLIDGASVHGLIYEYLAINNPEKVANLKIIKRSEKFGIPPIVTPASLSQEKVDKYREIFLNLHHDSIGKSIMDKLNIDRFVVVGDTLYNNVFQLKKYIDDEFGN